MKKTVFYWSPCLNPVGTVKSTLNSAISLMRYGKGEFQVTLINAVGEWDDHIDFLNKNNVKVLDFNFKFYKHLPKHGYIKSRISYLIIYFACFIPLVKLIKNSKPNYFISHLITSLPLTIMYLFKFNTKFILRISGMPQLNFIRKNFWKLVSNKIYLVTCPTIELSTKLKYMKLFKEKKLTFLQDAIIDVAKINLLSSLNVENFEKFKDKKIIFAAGRLTKQKNFTYLINEFAKFNKINDEFNLLILGDGEQKKLLQKKIKEFNLENKIYLMGHVKNVYSYFKYGEIFILSSLWEELGFVMIEAAFSNLFVISSDCPNGPSEFLDNNNNGILFENNKAGHLLNALKRYQKLDDKEKYIYKAKKNTQKYSQFRHFIVLKKILSREMIQPSYHK